MKREPGDDTADDGARSVTHPSMLDAALSYAERGWHVFPCAERGKTPLTPHGCKDATRDEQTIRAWWRQHPSANIGIATGAASRLVVLDVDITNGKRGDATLVALVRQHGPLGDTLNVVTGTAADHYYFEHPGYRIGNSTSKLGPGLDIRGDGGYVIGPPSIHPNGHRYSWTNRGELRPMPPWLLALLGPAKPEPPPRAPTPGRWGRDTLPRVQRALAYVDKLPIAVSGNRGHDALWRVACAVVQGFELPDGAAREVLDYYSKRCDPPWSAEELDHKIAQARAARDFAPGYIVNGAA